MRSVLVASAAVLCLSAPATAKQTAPVEIVGQPIEVDIGDQPVDVETSAEPFSFTGVAEFNATALSAQVGSFVVPSGMVLVLDGASIDLGGGATTVDPFLASLSIHAVLAGQAVGPRIGTEPKNLTLSSLDSSSAVSSPVSWRLPPIQLPPNTTVSVSALRNRTIVPLDFNVFVGGHLVPAAP